jgi:hypothetical protein
MLHQRIACRQSTVRMSTVVRGQVRHLPAEYIIEIGKLNSADAKFRESSSKFSFSPCKKLVFEKKKSQKFDFYF